MQGLLEYIFSSIWIFFGTVILLSIITNSIVEIIIAIKGYNYTNEDNEQQEDKN